MATGKNVRALIGALIGTVVIVSGYLVIAYLNKELLAAVVGR